MFISENFNRIKQVGSKYYGLPRRGLYFDTNVTLSVSIDNMQTWTNIIVEETQNDEYIVDIVGDDSRQIAISGSGIFYATDGINFTRSDQEVSISTGTQIAYSYLTKTDEGYLLFNGNIMLKSVDGVEWESIFPYSDMDKVVFNGIEYYNFTSKGVSKSNDLVEWEYLGESELHATYNQIEWINGRFITINYNTSEIITSIDGVNIDTRVAVNWGYSTILWDGTRYITVADAFNKTIRVSTDAVTWTSITTNIPNSFSNSTSLSTFNGYYYVLNRSDGNNKLFISSNLITWTQIPLSFETYAISTNSNIIVVSGSGGNTAYSTDGNTFTTKYIDDNGVSRFWNNIIWSGTKFYMSTFTTTSDNLGIFAESSDGINWLVHHVSPYIIKILSANGDEVLGQFTEGSIPFYSISNDGGYTWNFGSREVLGSEAFSESFYKNGKIIGYQYNEHYVCVSTDNGSSWEVVNFTDDSDIWETSISFIKADDNFIISNRYNNYTSFIVTTDFETFETPIEADIISLKKLVKSGEDYVGLCNDMSYSLISSKDLSFWVDRSIYSEDNSITWNEYNVTSDVPDKFDGYYFNYINPTFSGTIGEHGNMFRTSNDFINWTIHESLLDYQVNRIINNDTHYIVQVSRLEDYYGSYLISADLINWEEITPFSDTYNELMACSDTSLCTINNDGFIEMISITDGTSLGTSTSIDVGYHNNSETHSIAFIEDTWFANVINWDTSEASVWKSTDGLIWDQIITLHGTGSYFIFMGKLDGKTLIAPVSSYSSCLYYSSTDNETWVEEGTPSGQYKDAIAHNNIGVLLTDFLVALVSEDLGETWIEKSLPMNSTPYSYSMKIIPYNSQFILIINKFDSSNINTIELFITENFSTYTPINTNPEGYPPSYSLFVSGIFNNLPIPSDIIIRETDDKIFLVIPEEEQGGG